MMKILGILGKVLGPKEGALSMLTSKGVIGKISFKRSAAIILLTAVAIPDFEKNGLTTLNVMLMIGAIAAVAIPQILERFDKK